MTCSGQRFAQIYKALDGDAMLVSLLGAQIHVHVWLLETNRKICL